MVKLPAITLPVTLENPVLYEPVLANTNVLAVPPMVTAILPLSAAEIFDVPAVTGNPEVLAVTPVS